MESSRNGDVTVTYEHQLFGRRRNVAGGGGGFATYLDLVREEGDAGKMPPRRPLPAPPPHGVASWRRTYADGELDVFAAERYFKGAMDGADGYNKVDLASPVMAAAAARPAVAVSRPAPWTTRASVASAGSSGSTANSQAVLLREQRRRDKCCAHVGGILRSCSGKRSVHVGGAAVAATEPAGDPGDELPPATASRIECIGAARMRPIGREEGTAATSEYSSSSFRSNFTLLAPVKVTIPASGGDDDDDDVGSESSSDLFEIKSLMIDDCRGYEPSEASVQWSLLTPAPANCSFPASGRGGGGGGKGRPAAAVAVRQQQHRRQADRPVGLLAGCVSHRAVDVSAVAAVCRPPPPPGAPATATRRRSDLSRFAHSGHL
ncbi:hypothetical protein OsJ_31471 [Oryza sativa Japonica Group]|uniref:Uncharacterized protein n=1 Tax=Oryza sativa subsp. japonica TaxID=39947 RepID=A3C4L3_ORYSJ|nr:hypothetical protein OsJ_31471 [Oryza sativa Japonica Group]